MSVVDNELGPVCEAEVKGSVRITPENRDEIRRLTLHIEDPAFRFREGQSIGIVVKGPHAFGNQYHTRRYSIAEGRNSTVDDGVDIEILVRRCFYVDEVSGERYPGVASNYLCDAAPGQRITITGPYRSPFTIPQDSSANLLMIGTGTGVAPFRAFIQQVYQQKHGWEGKVRVFYGAKSGMDLFYVNDAKDDLSNYYDEKTFQAFKGIIGKPLAGDEHGLQASLEENAAEAWDLMQDSKTYVFLAGLKKVSSTLDQVMSKAAGSEKAWHELQERMRQDGRWAELLYS